MQDKELLELAAKAADIDGDDFVKWRKSCGVDWNPLTDDGDALRLAVKLGMSLGLVVETGGMAHWGPVTYTQARQQIDELQLGRKRGNSGPMEAHGDNALAATRRAIVRAAAEIGLLIPNDRVEGGDACGASLSHAGL